MSKPEVKSSKIVKAKLHSGAFLSGINLGVDLSAQPGAKQVEMTLVGSTFLRVTKGAKSILIPFTNIVQIEEEAEG